MLHMTYRRFPTIYLTALVAIAICLPIALRPSRASDKTLFVSTATRAGRLAVFDDVWETIQERYYDPTFRGLDWDATRLAFRPAAADAKSTEDFYELLRRMIAPLKDPHTRVFSPEEKFDWWNPKFITVGVTVRDIEGSPTVVHVDPNSTAQAAGLRVGDVVISVDNVNASELIARRAQHADLSPMARPRLVRGLFDGNPGTRVTLTWKRKDGRIKSTTLQRYWSQRSLGFRSTRHDGIVVITLDAFTQSIASDFLKQLPEMIGNAHGIILDLRGNGGGDAEAMANVASAFLGTGISLGKFADRSGAGFELVTTPRLLQLSLPTAARELPMVVLTSESTSSAAEILASTLQQQRRARVIGSMTCGCVLAIRNRHTLPDGGVLDVSEFDYKTAEGIRLEGVGITPNVPITTTRADLYAKRDGTLVRAKKYLARAIN
ncbi:MAG TPA: S41 family peptidase [Pyrinomonadaceae bacterium]|nr:S41 family peptidase [Pyrinomonadaceae bacterium]